MCLKHLVSTALICNTPQWFATSLEDGGDVMKPEPWVSLEEIAQHLGVSEDTVHRWIRARKMPAHKVGHFWKFKVSQVDAWVQKDKTTADEE